MSLAPETTITEELLQLGRLDQYERRYLSSRICGLCEHPLDRVGCSSYLFPACPESVRIQRRANALKHYTPRLNRRGKK